MAVIEYSVLGYYPSAISDEKINVGILFHELDSGRRTFYVMKNWECLEKFDNELDISFYLGRREGKIRLMGRDFN